MKRKLRLVCTMLICIMLFSSEMFRIGTFAAETDETAVLNADSGENADSESLKDNGSEAAEDIEYKEGNGGDTDEDLTEEPAEENPEGENPDEENPEGENPDEENPEGENPDEENPEDEEPEEEPEEEEPEEEEVTEEEPEEENSEEEQNPLDGLTVTGAVELDSSRGCAGSRFHAKLHVSIEGETEEVDLENLSCKWIYDGRDVTLLTDSHDPDETCTFQVVDSKDTTTVISAEIYLDEVCIGELEGAEYQILEINSERMLKSFTAKIADGMEVDLMSTGECVTGGEITFTAGLNMAYIESLGQEVAEAAVIYASDEKTMSLTSEGQYSASMDILNNSSSAAVPKVKIILDGGIEIYVSGNKALKVDREAPVVNVSLTDGSRIIRKEWLSQSNGCENLQLKIDVKDASEIKTCKVTSDAEAGEYGISRGEDGYYTAISPKEGITEYRVYVEDRNGNCSEAVYTVKIDNTEPSAEVKVSFTGEARVSCEEEIKDGYTLGSGQGAVYSDGSITMNLEVCEGESRSKEASGLGKVTARVLITTIEGEREQNFTFACNGEMQTTAVFCISGNQPDPEMNYQIKEVSIVDLAGNDTKVAGEDGCVDDVVYAVDNRMPEITYQYPDGITEMTPEETIYYGEAITGTVEIADLNLSQYLLLVENEKKYDEAKIKEESIDEKKAVYSFALDTDGKYQINTQAESILGTWVGRGSIDLSSPILIVDTIAPVIELKLFEEGGAELANYANQYYRTNINAEVLITEKNMDLAEVSIFCDGGLQAHYTQDDFLMDAREELHTLLSSLSEEGEYYIEISCIDKTGKTASFTSDHFFIDKTAPKVTITYDNYEARNEFYYNVERTATIEVVDAALDKESAELKIVSAQGNKPGLSGWTESGQGKEKTYTAQVKFERDDIYDVSFVCEDLADNQGEECEGGHFVIDRAAPVILIEFNQYDSKNEVYFKEDRTAIITVEDLSFDPDSFSVSNASEEDVIPVSSSGSFSGSETYHKTEILCNEEGTYLFSVSAQDLAGNEAVTVSSERFVIDKTAPEIEISGITHESANQGELLPVIAYRDKYLDDNSSEVLLSGYKNGTVSVSAVTMPDKDSRNVEYDVFPKTREKDDVYTLTVHIEDLAGNWSEEEYVFSVNRFGSTFGVNKATAELLENYYTNMEQDVVITEVNVDHLKQEEITVSFNGEPRTLKKNRDYQITAQGDQATWKSYTYTIYKQNFEKEGQYTVSIFSKDKANNQSDNNVQNLEIAFAVDKTSPSIVVTELKDEGVYEESELTFRMDIKDNMCLEGASLIINGVEAASYDSDELTDAVSYKLSETKEPMNIIIRATDVVGNTSEKKFSRILLGQELKTIEEEKAALSDDFSETAPMAAGHLQVGFFIITGMAAVLILSVAALKRKKEQGEL